MLLIVLMLPSFAIPKGPVPRVRLPVLRVHVANVFTLPPMSTVHSPAGMMIPALAAVAAVAKIAPAAVFLIK